MASAASANVRARALRLLAVGGVVVASMLPAAAFAQDVGTYGNGNTNTGSGNGDQGSNDPAESTSGTGGSLPFTGGDIVGLALIGAGAVAGGTVLVRGGRRRTAHV